MRTGLRVWFDHTDLHSIRFARKFHAADRHIGHILGAMRFWGCWRETVVVMAAIMVIGLWRSGPGPALGALGTLILGTLTYYGILTTLWALYSVRRRRVLHRLVCGEQGMAMHEDSAEWHALDEALRHHGRTMQEIVTRHARHVRITHLIADYLYSIHLARAWCRENDDVSALDLRLRSIQMAAHETALDIAAALQTNGLLANDQE